MGKRTGYEPGIFCWVEMSSTDVASATSFYEAVFGWSIEEKAFGPGNYSTARVEGDSVAGLYQTQTPDVPSHWLSYVTVEDVDLIAKRAVELGATLLADPVDAADLGRMAVLQDPGGAVFALWKPITMPGAQLVNDPGSFTMTQLNSQDPEKSADFYSTLFGWTVKQAAPDVPFWSISVGERLNAGLSQNTNPGPDNWLVYFTTSDIKRSVEAVRDAGGNVVVPLMPIPAGVIAVVQDPQGGWFGLFEGPVDD